MTTRYQILARVIAPNGGEVLTVLHNTVVQTHHDEVLKQVQTIRRKSPKTRLPQGGNVRPVRVVGVFNIAALTAKIGESNANALAGAQRVFPSVKALAEFLHTSANVLGTYIHEAKRRNPDLLNPPVRIHGLEFVCERTQGVKISC